MADRLRAAAAASIGTIASARDDEVRFISPGHSAIDGICPPVSSGSRRGHPRRRVDAEEFDLSASFPDSGPSAWSDDEDDRDGGSTSYGPSRDVIGRCRPCSSDDGTGGEDVDEFDEADVLWDCSTEIDVTVDNDLGQWAEDDDPHDDYAPRAHHLYGEYKDEEADESTVDPRVGMDRSTTASFTHHLKNARTEAYKKRLAFSQMSCRAAVNFRCPCGFQHGGEFCADRISLTEETVLHEREQSFAVPITHQKRLKHHAIRLQVHDPRAPTAEMFFPAQKASSYHYFVDGRPVCAETYGEVCALSRKSMEQVQHLAMESKVHGTNLDTDEAVASLMRHRPGRSDQRSMDVKVFLESLARDCCESIPDGDTIDSLSADPDLARDDEDGGVEWRLPFRCKPPRDLSI